MRGGLIAPATSTTQNFTKKIEKNFFCINVYKNAKEKLSIFMMAFLLVLLWCGHLFILDLPYTNTLKLLVFFCHFQMYVVDIDQLTKGVKS